MGGQKQGTSRNALVILDHTNSLDDPKASNRATHYRTKSNLGLPTLNSSNIAAKIYGSEKTPKKEGRGVRFTSFITGQQLKVSNSPLKDHVFKQSVSGIAGSYFYEPRPR